MSRFAFLMLLLVVSLQVSHSQIFFESTRRVNFSSPFTKDVFELKAMGRDTLNARFIFQIKDQGGHTLRLDTLGAWVFTERPYWKTQAQKAVLKDKVMRGLASFFNADRFDKPAIAPDAEFDGVNPSLDIWKEIKSDTTAIGFHYRHYSDGEIAIAYSKVRRKVVVYFAFP